jgi:hypothetical protein
VLSAAGGLRMHRNHPGGSWIAGTRKVDTQFPFFTWQDYKSPAYLLSRLERRRYIPGSDEQHRTNTGSAGSRPFVIHEPSTLSKLSWSYIFFPSFFDELIISSFGAWEDLGENQGSKTYLWRSSFICTDLQWRFSLWFVLVVL